MSGVEEIPGSDNSRSESLSLKDTASTDGAAPARRGALDRLRLFAEFYRYFILSGLALLVDLGLFYVLNSVFGLPHLIANPISFLCGLLVIYFGSVHWVFGTRRLQNASFEFFTFAAIGAAGLLVNEACLWALADGLGLAAFTAKLLAAGASFVFNFVLRKLLLFR